MTKRQQQTPWYQTTTAMQYTRQRIAKRQNCRFENEPEGPYIVVKILSNNDFLVRKLQTNSTQQRIRLQPFNNNQKLPNISVSPNDFQPDKEGVIQHDDVYAITWQ